MDRREALARISILVGGTLTLPTLAGVMSGCSTASDTTPWVPQTLSRSQNDLVIALTERILPATDTPGAREARVNTFIDLMLSEWYPAPYEKQFLDGLADVEQQAENTLGMSFLNASPAQQDDVLTALAEEAVHLREGGMTDPPPFFFLLKELTLVGYYTSEIGATVELRYERAPGRYDGCVPFDEIGRAWA